MGLEHGGQNSNVTFRIISGHDVQGAFCGADDDITWFFTVYSGLLVVVAEVGIYDCWAWRPARLEVLSRVETCNVDVVERRSLYRMNYARFNAFLVKHCWQIERLRVLSGLPWREPDHFWRTVYTCLFYFHTANDWRESTMHRFREWQSEQAGSEVSRNILMHIWWKLLWSFLDFKYSI
jgi:hypothetical protein